MAGISLALTRGFAFHRLPRLTRPALHVLVKQFSEPHPCLVKLRLRIPNRTAHDFRALVVLVALYIVQNEDGSRARRELIDGALQIHSIYRSGQLQISDAEISPRSAGLFIGLGGFLKRRFRHPLLPELHQHDIYRQTVKPSRESRLSTERADFPE